MGKRHDNLPYPLKHALWAKQLAKKVDRKTRRWINTRVRFILEDIPDPSSRQQVLAEHSALLDACCRAYVMQIMAGESLGSVDKYLAFEGHLQRNLVALGLTKQKAKKVMDLAEYIRQKDREAKELAEGVAPFPE